MLPPALQDHFKSPRHAGRVAGATGRGREENPACGDIVEIEVRVEAERVAAAGFLAQGCAATVACASFVAARAHGSTIAAARALDPDALLAEVGETNPVRRHAMVLAVRALGSALGR